MLNLKNQLIFWFVTLNLLEICFAQPKQQQKGCRLCASCGGDFLYYGGQKLNTGDYGDWIVFGQQCSEASYQDRFTQWQLCCQKDEAVNQGFCRFCKSCGGRHTFNQGTRLRELDWGGFNIFGNSCDGYLYDSYDQYNLCCTQPHITSLCDDCSPSQAFGGRKVNNGDWGRWFINNRDQCGSSYNIYKTSGEFNLCSNYYCQPGYTPSNGWCYPNCLQNCQSCNSPNTCDVCNFGFIKDSLGNCVKCQIGNCYECRSTVECKTCNQGYQLNNSKCKPICSNNCTICSAPNTCDVCSLGFIKDSLGNCVKCQIGNCYECRSTSECKTCNQGYQLNNGKCKAICSNNCTVCSAPNTCDVCSFGFIKDSLGNCVECKISNCYECSSISECKTCNQGYQLDKSKCKAICSNNCTVCSAPNTCDVCSFGFIKDSLGSCVECKISNCYECSSTSECKTCNQGYQLNNNKCEPICSNNCTVCSAPNQCDVCSFGFIKDSLGNCVECKLSNCYECSSTSECKTCNQGYQLNNCKCEPICSNNCTVCSAPNQCDVCEKGYLLNTQKGICEIICLQNCEKCNDASTCTQCIKGLQLNAEKTQCNQIVISCPINCICQQNDICEECREGYQLQNNYCIPTCPENCVQCEIPSICHSCQTGYTLDQGRCKSIIGDVIQSSTKNYCQASQEINACTQSTLLKLTLILKIIFIILYY